MFCGVNVVCFCLRRIQLVQFLMWLRGFEVLDLLTTGQRALVSSFFCWVDSLAFVDNKKGSRKFQLAVSLFARM